MATQSDDSLVRRVRRAVRPRARLRGMRRRMGLSSPARVIPTRYDARTPAEAAQALATVAQSWVGDQPGMVVVLGGDHAYGELIRAELTRRGLSHESMTSVDVDQQPSSGWTGTACIVLAVQGSEEQFDVARRLVGRPETADIPLEYVGLPRQDNAPILEWDRYIDGDFVSPLLVKHGDAFYRIYRQALERFRLKMDIRDYLDLCQLLDSVVARGIPGDIAEFGSFKGHSGFLASRVLEHLGSDKTLHMFDMFENFPEETVGIDGFWSGTHAVDFEQVRSKFTDRDNVAFIKGDFTETLAASDVGTLALAFIDCDSYRATRYLLPRLWEQHIPVGGIVAMEDYGHAALLGNRLAVHEFFDGRTDAFTSFSQFSGLFTAIKLDGGADRRL